MISKSIMKFSFCKNRASLLFHQVSKYILTLIKKRIFSACSCFYLIWFFILQKHYQRKYIKKVLLHFVNDNFFTVSLSSIAPKQKRKKGGEWSRVSLLTSFLDACFRSMNFLSGIFKKIQLNYFPTGKYFYDFKVYVVIYIKVRFLYRSYR
jgi:hypothetical protein